MDLGDWTLPKVKNESLSETSEAARVVWPPILSSDCSTWLATRKAKSDSKEKLEDSLNQWLVSSSPLQSGKTDYVAAIREGVEKSMEVFTEYLRESTPDSRESFATDLILEDKYSEKVREDDVLNPWLVPATSDSFIKGVDKIANDLEDVTISIPPSTSTSLWLSDCIDSGISRAESMISDAMSTLTMDTQEDGWSVWLSPEAQDFYAYDGVESEASIEIIDSINEDFEHMDEI